MKALLIGMDKDLLKKGSVSFERHKKYAEKIDEIHAVVFARKEYGREVVEISKNAWAYPTNSSNTLMLFYDAFRMGKKILKEKGDWVISAQDPFESGIVTFFLSKVTGVPFLLQEHGDFFSEPYWKKESFANRVRFLVGLFLLKKADCVRVVAERIKNTLIKKGIDEKNIIVTPVYVDVESFSNAEIDKTLEAERPKDGILFVTLARLVPQKNLAMLIEAFVDALKKGINARLVIYGKGECENKLRDMAENAPEGTVLFKEWTDNPASVIKTADVYVLSSNYEGWGRVCLETLATGTLFLMTDVGCAGEVVFDGVNGLVVPVNDRWAFSNGISYIAKNKDELKKKFIPAGLETVNSLPTFNENIEKYVESLKMCLSGKK